MGRRLAQIALDMQAREARLAQGDIHDLLRRERELRNRPAVGTMAGGLLLRMDEMALRIAEGVRLDEQIIGWLVANVPEDLLALAAREADTDIEDYPLA